MIVHAFCPKSIKSKHKGCNLKHGEYICRLAPQAKITGILRLDKVAKQRKPLRLINEPFYINVYSFDNEKMIYASLAKKMR